MRIGVIVDNEFYHDIRVVREVIALESGGHEINVICFDFGSKKIDFPQAHVTRIRIRKKLKEMLIFATNLIPLYEFFWAWHISRFIRRYGIQIIHSNDLYMSRATYWGIKLSNRKIPFILDLHENFPDSVLSYNWSKGWLRRSISRPRIWKKKEVKYLGYPKKIIVLSESFKNELINQYPFLTSKEFLVYPNVPDLKEYNPTEYDPNLPSIRLNAPVFFYFGSIAERRGIFTFLDAMKKVNSTDHKISLLIIGPIDKADKDRFFQYLGDLQPFIQYIPWVDLKYIYQYMGKADVGIAPFIKNKQHESGIANKIYQYMMAKKPVIVSDCKPQANLVSQCGCGIVFKDEDELIDAILQLSYNSNLRNEMGNKGHSAVINHFNSRVFEEAFITFYRT